MPRIRSAVLMGVLLGAHIASEPGAQNFPTRPVRYIMPLPAGSETDCVRPGAGEADSGTSWGQNVIVDNRPGGGMMIGTDRRQGCARRLHAGCMSSRRTRSTRRCNAKLPYDTLKDLSLHHADRQLLQRADRAPFVPGEERAGPHHAGQGATRQDRVCHGSRGHDQSHPGRGTEHRRGHQHGACCLQGRRAGDPGSAVRATCRWLPTWFWRCCPTFARAGCGRSP